MLSGISSTDASRRHPISESDLAQMPWLGNVRELRNFVERAAIGATAEAHPFDPAGSAGSEGLAGVAFEQPFKEFRERWIEQGEREYLRRLLDRHDRNVAGAAEQARAGSHLRLQADPQARALT